MKAETARQIIEAGDRMGLEIRAYDGGYSGRGMYGATTAAVVVGSIGDFAASVGWAVDWAIARSGDPREMLADISEARCDSLGRDLIVY